MNISLPLIFGSSTILALVAYFAFNSTVSQPSSMTSEEIEIIVNQAISKTRGRDTNEQYSNDISSLKDEISDLRAELIDLKQENPPTPNNDLRALKQEIVALRKLFEKERTTTSIQTVQNTVDKQERKPEMTEQGFKEAAENLARKNRERWENIGNTFQAETIDEQWSSNAMQTITDIFENNTAITASLSQIDCRATSCMIDVQHKDSNAANTFAVRFPRTISKIFPSADFHYENHEDGSISMSMYLVRADKDATQDIAPN